jgi:hypothetical protein
MNVNSILQTLRTSEHIGSGEDAAKVVESLVPRPVTWAELFEKVEDEE